MWETNKNTNKCTKQPKENLITYSRLSLWLLKNFMRSEFGVMYVNSYFGLIQYLKLILKMWLLQSNICTFFYMTIIIYSYIVLSLPIKYK